MDTTTLRVERELKLDLDELKSTKNESYADVIRRLVRIAKEENALSKDEIRQIEDSLKDLKAGRVLSLKEAEQKWGI
ncbi:MAG: hypothetical protein HY917_03535 [Candidatus Diapherotrites archaeon]|nr:hypothetical protein [Candidatus Diapherotrites archaeon]